jgi:hypothetical protein
MGYLLHLHNVICCNAAMQFWNAKKGWITQRKQSLRLIFAHLVNAPLPFAGKMTSLRKQKAGCEIWR